MPTINSFPKLTNQHAVRKGLKIPKALRRGDDERNTVNEHSTTVSKPQRSQSRLNREKT